MHIIRCLYTCMINYTHIGRYIPSLGRLVNMRAIKVAFFCPMVTGPVSSVGSKVQYRFKSCSTQNHSHLETTSKQLCVAAFLSHYQQLLLPGVVAQISLTCHSFINLNFHCSLPAVAYTSDLKIVNKQRILEHISTPNP